jgi:hypothetical protein
MRTYDIRPGLACAAELTAAISRLRLSKKYKEPLVSPSCRTDDPPGLVVRRFHFKGKGRDVVIDVKLHAKVMVAFLKALRKCRTIQVTQSYTSTYSGSYRTYEQQNTLYQRYISGTGYKAANPCHGYHRTGRAVDLFQVTDEEAAAMQSVREDGKRFYWGKVFGDPPHFSYGELG